MPPPTRDEAERIVGEIVRAWDARNTDAIDLHLSSPIGDLESYESILGRPVGLEGVEPVDDRRSIVGLRSSQGGILVYTMLRGRDGRVRIDLTAATGDAENAAASFGEMADFARMLASPGPTVPRGNAKRRRWRGAPKKFPRVGDIPYLGLGRRGSSAEDLVALESEIGRSLPDGYGPYVTRFGEAIDSTFVRVYPPTRIRGEREAWRERIDAYWLWTPSADGFDQEAALGSYVLADTLSGDELLWHPDRPGAFYVLPRNEDVVIHRDMNFEALLAWAVSSGDLDARTSLRYVVPLCDRVSVPLSFDDVDPRPLAKDLSALGDDMVCSHERDGTTIVLWPSRGIQLLASDEPYVGLTHEPTSDAGFIELVLGALAAHDIVREQE